MASPSLARKDTRDTSSSQSKVSALAKSRLKLCKNPNHPRKGDVIKAEPIRELRHIDQLKRYLKMKSLRDYALFILGINTNLRASDLVKLKVGDVKYMKPGQHITQREKKTKKLRQITLNNTVVSTLQDLIRSYGDVPDSYPLFKSRVGEGALTVPTVSGYVKGWCKAIGLRGNYSAHTLRKTCGYMHRTVFKTDIPTLMEMFNHASQRQLLEYLCIQEEELVDAYMKEL